MGRAERTSVKGRAFSLALVVGFTVSGIGLVAAGAAGPPGRQACPPGGGGSVTPSVSAGQTATASPCPTITTTSPASTSPSASPSPSVSPTPSATSSPSTTVTTTVTSSTSPTTPGPAVRTLTLESNKGKTTFGKSVTLSGGLTSANATCISSQSIKILRTVVGSDENVLFDSVTTNAAGTFSKSYTADRSAGYIAHVDSAPTCGEADSGAKAVLVRVKVSLALSDPKVPVGGKVRLKARVAPCGNHKGDKVVLFKLVGGNFAKVATARLSGTCTASWTRAVTKDTAYQVRWPKQDADHLRGSSRKKAVQAT